MVNSNAKQLSLCEASLLGDRGEGEREAQSPTGTSREGGREEERYPGSHEEEPFTKTRLVRAGSRNQLKRAFDGFEVGKPGLTVSLTAMAKLKTIIKTETATKHKQDQTEAVVSSSLPQADDPKASRKLSGTQP